ncbi:MAG: leucyl aminopeptidase, partial [Pseudomonadota bacterium]|nr:leucyl aminopeptidase [Pseudomonadota bacterium]
MPFAVAFANLKLPQKGTLLLAVKKGRDLGALGRDLDKKTGGALTRAMKTTNVDGGAGTSLELLAPPGTALE